MTQLAASKIPVVVAISCNVTTFARDAKILIDGGFRRGSDIVKALCMGARAVLIGRAYAYGLGAGGQAGVARALAILESDVLRGPAKALGVDELRAGAGELRERVLAARHDDRLGVQPDVPDRDALDGEGGHLETVLDARRHRCLHLRR